MKPASDSSPAPAPAAVETTPPPVPVTTPPPTAPANDVDRVGTFEAVGCYSDFDSPVGQASTRIMVKKASRKELMSANVSPSFRWSFEAWVSCMYLAGGLLNEVLLLGVLGGVFLFLSIFAVLSDGKGCSSEAIDTVAPETRTSPCIGDRVAGAESGLVGFAVFLANALFPTEGRLFLFEAVLTETSHLICVILSKQCFYEAARFGTLGVLHQATRVRYLLAPAHHVGAGWRCFVPGCLFDLHSFRFWPAARFRRCCAPVFCNFDLVRLRADLLWAVQRRHQHTHTHTSARSGAGRWAPA